MVMMPTTDPWTSDGVVHTFQPLPGPPLGRGAGPRSGLEVIRRSAWSVALITVATLGVALAVLGMQTPVYESRARVLVTPTDEMTAGSVTVSQPNLATERELVSSVAVAEIAADALGRPDDALALLEGLTVDSLADTEILELSYRHPDPAVAQRRAQAFAEAYLEYRGATASDELTASADELDAQLRALRRRFERVRQELDDLSSTDPNALVLRNEAAAIQEQLLARQLARLDVATASVTPGEIVEPASAPTSPVVPNHVFNGAVGLAAGLALSVGVAFVRDRLSERLRSPDEVETYLGAPILGRIPRIGSWRRKKRAMVVSLERPRSPGAESYRALRTSLLSATDASRAKSVVITSPAAGDGKSTTVANLAVSLARVGKRVAVVSADLRRPRLHEFFGVDGSVGLAEVLDGRAPLASATRRVTLTSAPWGSSGAIDVWLLPSGRVPENGGAELLTSDGMRKVVADLESAFDIVLIDVPPVLPVTDALVVAPAADGVVLVVGPESLSRSVVGSARQHLDRVGARVLGAVLNGQSSSQGSYGSYG